MCLMSSELICTSVFSLKLSSNFCSRTVPSPEIQLHRDGWSHHGRRSGSLPHHRLHHRDPDCPQGAAPSLHGQSVSLLVQNLNGCFTDGLSGAFFFFFPSMHAALLHHRGARVDRIRLKGGGEEGEGQISALLAGTLILCQPAPVEH